VISVVLVDDHPLVREGIRRAIDRTEDLTLVGEAQSMKEALAVVPHTSPDVVVVDVRLPDGNGIDLCQRLRDEDPARAVVVLTMYGDSDHVRRAREAGASNFVTKGAPAREVIAAIRRAASQPDKFFAAGITEALPTAERGGARALTDREREVLTLLAEGLGVSGISKRLYISESTTKTHMAKVYAKLGVSNRAQALMTAIRQGLVDPDR
jgi:DNA-binding NarL/FixJ family response regulator